jgi:hypothetical protein
MKSRSSVIGYILDYREIQNNLIGKPMDCLGQPRILQMSAGGFSIPDIPLTVSAWVLKSKHPADCQHAGSQSRTVHGQSEFGKPSRCYLGSPGHLGLPGMSVGSQDTRVRFADGILHDVSKLPKSSRL